MRLLALLMFAFVLMLSPAAFGDDLKVGDTAPDFTMTGSDGKTYKLSELNKQGKAVVVAWFPRAFTGGCTAECKSMKAEGDKIRNYEVAYFTASNDPVADNKRFAEELGLDYPILSDPDSSVATKYGVLNETPKGKAARRWTFYIGADGKILSIDKGVKTATHGADVAATLGTLGVKKKK